MLTNCIISNNTSNYYGGGIDSSNNGSSPTIINCIISNNTANYGGGIRCANNYFPTIINCTIIGNIASNSGGGIYLYDNPLAIVNSILWGNVAGGSSNEIYLNGNNIIDITYSNIEGGDPNNPSSPWPGTGNIMVYPWFVNPNNNDYHLLPGSPCIDAGTNNMVTYPNLPTYDIDGQPRPQDGNEDGTAKYDMGADEYGTIPQSSIALNSGWNLISFSMEPTDTTIATVLNPISGKYVSVWAFMNGAWKVYDPQNPGFSDLTTMEAGWGYWINMSEAATLSVSGSAPSNSISLNNGWNLVGCNISTSPAVEDALDSINGKYVSVWAYINGTWKVYDPANPGFSDLTTMDPNYGYWIKTTEACIWTMP